MNRINTLGTSKVVALSVAVAVTLLALLPGAWSAAIAQTAGTATATPSATATSTTVPAGASATVQAGSGQTINIPAGAFSENVLVTFHPIIVTEIVQTSIGPIEVPTFDTQVVLQVFELSSLLPDGSEVNPDEPIEMTFDIDAATLAAAGGDLDRVVLQFFDEDTGQWTSVECSGNTATQTVTCSLPHFSVWALTIVEASDEQVATPAPADTGLGVFGAESGNSTNIAVLLLAIAGLAAVAGAGARFAVRRSRIE